jgi:hypothetical protein
MIKLPPTILLWYEALAPFFVSIVLNEFLLLFRWPLVILNQSQSKISDKKKKKEALSGSCHVNN